MLNLDDLKTIKETTKEFFEKTTFEVEIIIHPQKEETISIDLKTEEPKILIGERGQTLSEIQRLLKSILRTKIKEPFYIELDINDYKKKKTDYLKELARSIADEVVLTKKEKMLAPMQAYERRIVHLELAGRNNVTTESIGREPERRIVIRPYP